MKARKACAAMGLAGKKSIFWETSVKNLALRNPNVLVLICIGLPENWSAAGPQSF